MPEPIKGDLRNRIIWGVIERARQEERWRRQAITVSGTSGSTNGFFVIDSINTSSSWATTSITLPDSWVDPPPKPRRSVNLKELERRRSREKAARKARKKTRRAV